MVYVALSNGTIEKTHAATSATGPLDPIYVRGCKFHSRSHHARIILMRSPVHDSEFALAAESPGQAQNVNWRSASS